MARGDITVRFFGDTRDVKKKIDGLSGTLDRVGKNMMTFGTRMTIGVTAPLALIGKASFDAASDLNESMSKANAIFGKNAAAVRKWAEGAATDFGQSNQQALENAASFGNMFRQLGIGVAPATKMSKTMVELASDFASFHNADISEVLLAQQAAFRGEYDAVQRFVPTINAAAVEQKAMAMTGKDNAAELTAQEKAAAAYALMLEGAGKAAGDFDKTADGAANKQRTLAGRMKDVEAKLGKALIPLFETLATVVENVADWFSKLSPNMQKFITWGAIALAVIGPLTTAIGGLAVVVGVLASPITVAVLAIAAIGAALYLLWTNWDTIWAAIANNPVISVIVGLVTALVAPFVLIVLSLIALAKNWDEIWGWIKQAATDAKDWIVTAFNNVVDFFGGLPGRIWGALSALPGLLFQAASSALSSFADAAGARFAATYNWFLGIPGTIIGALGHLAGGLYNAGVDAIQGLWNGLKSLAERVKNWVADLAGTLVDAITDPLGILSPSTVFHDIGENMMAGLALGLEGGAPAVIAQVGGVADASATPFSRPRVEPVNGGEAIQLVVNAQTNASAADIAAEMAWLMRTRGR